MEHIFDRLVPSNFDHVTKYPLRVVLPPLQIDNVETMLSKRFWKHWRALYNQGREGACVGFGESEAMTYYNRVSYDARWLWNEAKKIDEWSDTNPGDNNGSSLSAGFDVLRTQGHRQLRNDISLEPDLKHGIAANRWCTNVDEIRTAIATNNPVVMGTHWYSAFNPGSVVRKKHDGHTEYAVETRNGLGSLLGGHCYIFLDASDERQAFRTPNSWGIIPYVWFPYELVNTLLNWNGEAGVITDR